MTKALKRAAAHERQRCNFDFAGSQFLVDLFGRREHFHTKRRKGAQIRVDLVFKAPGRKTEIFSGFTAGREKDSLPIAPSSIMVMASATAKKVLPVPAGPRPKPTRYSSFRRYIVPVWPNADRYDVFGFQNNFVDIDFRFLVGFGTADAGRRLYFLLADFNARLTLE